MEIRIDKLYRYDRTMEPCSMGIPLAKGVLTNPEAVWLYDPEEESGSALPLQVKTLSTWEDGSVRFLFLRFLADLPANKGKKLELVLPGDAVEKGAQTKARKMRSFQPVKVQKTPENTTENMPGKSGFRIETVSDESGLPMAITLVNHTNTLVEEILAEGRTYGQAQFEGPVLNGNGNFTLDTWELVEEGPVCAIVKAKGRHEAAVPESEGSIDFEVKLTAWAGKPWFELSYRIINCSQNPFEVESLHYRIYRNAEHGAFVSEAGADLKTLDSTGCGDSLKGAEFDDGPVYQAKSTAEAEKAALKAPVEGVRTSVASSNYKTNYMIGRDGTPVKRTIDADWLLKEANEHFDEVFYGSFFADVTDENGGVCATVFQAQQNYPKALEVSDAGIDIALVPEGVEEIILQMGMSREQKVLFHFHQKDTPFTAINDRSHVYQLPIRPYVSAQVHRESGVWPDIFPERIDPEVEMNLVSRADGHGRALGMLNFGDSYDTNYTNQGRGGGKLVWCNNEYDYPHSCALLYARTGFRRFLDYNIASASHWMDVDVCHYHTDPLYIGGQWEHCGGHTEAGVMVCSHEWVEGLLDYYHLTGDERGLETAIGIGENVQRLLEMPMYQKAGEANARETGWALRTLTALYVETHDKSWLVKCDKIVQDFHVWEQQYGHWLAPYTDNTLIRVAFMISVAIGSLMRYYRIFPSEDLKGLILRAVDDMIENCYVEDWGIFYYKELPSLNRLGNNTLVLEALTAAYDLTGDPKYLAYGEGTFRNAMKDFASYNRSKKKVENTVLVGNASSKTFAQSMIPLSVYYRAVMKEKVDKRV